MCLNGVRVAYIKKNEIIGAIMSAVLIMFSIGFGTIIQYNKQPKLIEVYRGNTELRVKYVIVNNDTISCDSIVVLKNK